MTAFTAEAIVTGLIAYPGAVSFECSGGNVHTIYVGPVDADGRAFAVIGPFDADGQPVEEWRHGELRGSPYVYVGPDDDSGDASIVLSVDEAVATVEQMADIASEDFPAMAAAAIAELDGRS